MLARLLGSAYFDKPAPKSLDRDAFDPSPVAALSAADGAATLTAFTAAAVARSAELLPEPPSPLAGDGRRTAQRLPDELLRQMLGGEVGRWTR